MRIDKLLEELNFGGRKKVKQLLRAKQVVVDGVVCQREGQNVDPRLQEILVKGERITGPETVYYLLNKPAGVVSARSDAQHETVLDCLRVEDRKPGIYPIGRLDRDTEGLVLLTNNGPLGYRMLHPRHHVDKTYLVEVNGLLAADAPDFFAAGVVFHDGSQCKPARLEILSANETHSRARITISEGKFHQVKKMFLAYGVKVVYLKRLQFGPFRLEEDLRPGDYRRLTAQEVQSLKQFLD